jgi:hypothetical protein
MPTSVIGRYRREVELRTHLPSFYGWEQPRRRLRPPPRRSPHEQRTITLPPRRCGERLTGRQVKCRVVGIDHRGLPQSGICGSWCPPARGDRRDPAACQVEQKRSLVEGSPTVSPCRVHRRPIRALVNPFVAGTARSEEVRMPPSLRHRQAQRCLCMSRAIHARSLPATSITLTASVALGASRDIAS